MVKIGEILVQKGYITQQQLDGVMAVKGDAQIGQVLIQWGLLTEQQLMEALEIQTPPPPPPPPTPPVQPQGSFLQQQQPTYTQPPVQPQVAQPTGGPDLTMDNLQTSKFKIDLKTMIYIGSLLVSGITMYFTFMGELDSRFAALEGSDKDLMVEIDTRLTELENKFTPIGDGVYSVDPNTTWPPSRGEYSMKQNMNANKITEIEKIIARLEKDLEKLEEDLDDKQDKQ
jgi:hypothetical protein